MVANPSSFDYYLGLMKNLLRFLAFFLIVGSTYAQSNLPACPSSGYRDNCFGTFTSADGEIYVGEFKDDKRNGQGTQTFASGSGGYAGEWKDGKYNGQGTYTFKGTKYVGEFKDYKRDGQGTLTFATGEKYVGEFKNDNLHGQGTFTFRDGAVYVGEYKDGKRNGQGSHTFASGYKYVGEFKDGKFAGLGTTYASNGSIIEQGIYADNKFVRSVPVQQATAPNQEIERLRAEVAREKRNQTVQNNTQSVKVIPINPEVKVCDDKVYIEKIGNVPVPCKYIGSQIMYETPSGFTILKDISLNTLWSKVSRDKDCKYRHGKTGSRNHGSDDYGIGDFSFDCNAENLRVNYEFSHYRKTNFISLEKVIYTTCSNSNWEQISEALITKFSQSNGSTPVEIKIGKYDKSIEFENKNVGLGEFLHAKLGNLSETDKLNCPGRIALQLTLRLKSPPNWFSRSFEPQVSQIVKDSNARDAGASVPKF